MVYNKQSFLERAIKHKIQRMKNMCRDDIIGQDKEFIAKTQKYRKEPKLASLQLLEKDVRDEVTRHQQLYQRRIEKLGKQQ